MPQGLARYNGWTQILFLNGFYLWILNITDHDIRQWNFQFENDSGIEKHEYKFSNF